MGWECGTWFSTTPSIIWLFCQLSIVSSCCKTGGGRLAKESGLVGGERIKGEGYESCGGVLSEWFGIVASSYGCNKGGDNGGGEGDRGRLTSGFKLTMSSAKQHKKMSVSPQKVHWDSLRYYDEASTTQNNIHSL